MAHPSGGSRSTGQLFPGPRERLEGRTQWVLAVLYREAWPFLQVDERNWLVERFIGERIGPIFGFATHGVPLQPVDIRSLGSVVLPARISFPLGIHGRGRVIPCQQVGKVRRTL